MGEEEDSSFVNWIDGYLESAKELAAGWWSQVKDFVAAQDFSAPIEFLALGLVIAATVLIIFIGVLRRISKHVPENETYAAHPTMVQGKVGTLSFLLTMVLAPSALVIYVLYSSYTGQNIDFFTEYAFLIVPISSVYLLVGIVGLTIWYGVSSSEMLIVKPEVIKLEHKLNSALVLVYLLLLALLWVLLGAFLNFLHKKVPIPISDWAEQLRGATGGKPHNHSDTYAKGSLAHWEPRDGVILRWLNIGSVTLYVKSPEGEQERTHEFRYMPRFKSLLRALDGFAGQ